MFWRLLLSCEHAGNRVPAVFARLFRGAAGALKSHRGWDAGALELARTLSRRLEAPLFHTDVTRLLVEVNRSLGHRALFSEFTRGLPPDDKARILARHYLPHRGRVEEQIVAAIARAQRVLHLSVHTFTPALHGVERSADIGFLYDPARRAEAKFCASWREALCTIRPDLRVRRNYPYLGKADGFTTYLRRRFPAEHYVGIELEVNQRWALGAQAAWRKLQGDLADSLKASRAASVSER